MPRSTNPRLTSQQRAVLEALAEQPDYGTSFAKDLATVAGLTVRGCQAVLYHLHDDKVLDLDEHGYHFKAGWVTS